jgi:hypothetical protein
MKQQQAFPNEEYHGMNLRDYFAAKAMQALIGCPHWREEAGEDLDMDVSKYTAISAYEMADAMMRAREE